MSVRRPAALSALALGALLGGVAAPAQAAAAPDVEHAAKLPPLRGTWAGEVKGDSVPYSLVVRLRTKDGVPRAKVTYPELGCSGTWTHDGGRREVRFTETITDDPGQGCASTVSLQVLDLEGDRLLVQYYGTTTVSAVLRPAR